MKKLLVLESEHGPLPGYQPAVSEVMDYLSVVSVHLAHKYAMAHQRIMQRLSETTYLSIVAVFEQIILYFGAMGVVFDRMFLNGNNAFTCSRPLTYNTIKRHDTNAHNT